MNRKWVAFGGGTGLSMLLSGLKHRVGGPPPRSPRGLADWWIDTLTAIVTVSDDGGSSGRLRQEFQILPPGDIRNCLVALSEDEALMAQLFRHRFGGSGSLANHSIGNLILTALTDMTGDFLQAIRLSSEVLKVKGKILPATMSNVTLVADLSDGSRLEGESRISRCSYPICRLRLVPERVFPLPETLEAIQAADVITLGPGSLFTSIIPNLLVEGIAQAITRSRAIKIYLCNLMTQPTETADFSILDHLSALFQNAPQLELDFALLNDRPISEALRAKYLVEGSNPVLPEGTKVSESLTAIEQRLLEICGKSCRLIPADLLEESTFVRHDPMKVVEALGNLLVGSCARFDRKSWIAEI